jgi:hypothetical protein
VAAGVAVGVAESRSAALVCWGAWLLLMHGVGTALVSFLSA